jgi:uncharacterized protein YbbC (DUF1343 family)
MRLLLLAAMTPLAAQEIAAVSRAIEDAIAKKTIPGAVCIAGQGDRLLHRKPYGVRSYETPGERMTIDTIFDAASLTKVVATASAIARLWEMRKIDLDRSVADYLPEYAYRDITVRDLLTHFSGLRPDVDLEPPWSGYETGVKLALADAPRSKPGEQFVYSDINFILLGEIVRRVTGVPLSDFAREQVFAPLEMTDTMFQPPAGLRPRIAPTERLKGELTSLRGLVHDPTARFMGGVAGHAGMFTTAADLAKFARMMLSGGGPVFRLETVRLFTSVHSPPAQSVRRGLGWDIDSPYSSPRGDLFPAGGFGHTGFTGASMWIDPGSNTYVILLTNAVHPVSKGPISALRRAVANAVAMEVAVGQTQTGLDVLIGENFAPFEGKRIGLITNHTGLARDGRRNIDAMLAAKVKLTALFSPEHGIAGTEDHENVANSKDPATGLPVYSLYQGERRRPTPESLANFEALAFDIQDIGARFYTYLSTMVNAMEVAAERGIPFFVLDRPNPINGVTVEGPMLDRDLQSFIGIRPMPVRHGMTLGELARMINEKLPARADLRVIAMKNWRREQWWDQTGLSWVNPSPNMKSLNGALLYPGVAMLEFNRNYSVGRGTDAPFERVSADWIRGPELAAYLNARFLPGVRFYPFADGVRIVVTDRDAARPTVVGIEIAAALLKLYPGKIDLERCAQLIGSRATIDALKAGENPRDIARRWNLESFLAQRKLYLLYD